MNTLRHRFPRHGTTGLTVLVLMELAVLCAQINAFPALPWRAITAWTTPVCWWGYILLVDACLYRRQGRSPLTDRQELFAAQCILSIVFWCVFEAYNRIMPGWQYVNLDANLAIRFTGYAFAFATIMPGLFLTCELLQSFDCLQEIRGPRLAWSETGLRAVMFVGLAGCVLPPFFPATTSRYLWAAVWVGWFLMLEPINYRRALPSLLRDWEHGDWARTVQLALAGIICGLLWEFWNMWAYTKWVYIFFPDSLAHWKYFEMPLLGFLGFIPFAFDYFAMFHFLASFFTREDKLGL